MTEQPAEPTPTREPANESVKAAYRLAVSLVTARDDVDLQQQIIHLAIRERGGKGSPVADLADLNVFTSRTMLWLVEYIAAQARFADAHAMEAHGKAPGMSDQLFRQVLKMELLEDSEP